MIIKQCNTMISFSEIESSRFGLNIYREKFISFNIEEVTEFVSENSNFDIIILRYPTNTLYEHYRLLSLPHSKVIHADSLLYYKALLSSLPISPLRNELIFEEVTPENSGLLQDIIPTIFKGYQNHYFANPILDRKKILEGYIEWAISYADIADGRIAWLVRDKMTYKLSAFATCSYDDNNAECEGVLYGVMPDSSGRGIYSDLIAYSKNYFKNKGYQTMLVSTQLQNYAVQNVWSKSGFKLSSSWETYHIINTDRIKSIGLSK